MNERREEGARELAEYLLAQVVRTPEELSVELRGGSLTVSVARREELPRILAEVGLGPEAADAGAPRAGA